MDMQKIPPIQQKRIVTFVNYFIVDTVSFLNTFINASENSLWKLEKRMRKLEATLKLLEVKLNFIPDAEVAEEPVSNTSAETTQHENIEKTEVTDNGENTNTIENATEASISESTNEIPEELLKYQKMVKVGVPIEAVKLKMRNEGLDPSSIKLE